MLKNSTLIVFGITCSSIAFSGTMGPVCTPGNVTIPCVESQWDLGIQALYLKTAFDTNKTYRFAASPATGFQRIQPDWDWGFKLEGAYHFNTAKDLALNWTHYRSEFEQGNLAGFNPFAGGLLSPFNLVSENNFDQVNLVLGQQADFGLVKHMRFYGGLQYARIETNDLNNFLFSGIPPLISSISNYDNTDFNGLGPVVGINYAYNLTPAFSLTANGSGSLLYGSSRYSAGLVAAPVDVVLVSVHGSKKAIVPSLEAKLGLNYAYTFPQGVLNFEGGYQVLNYFNALQTQGINGIFSPTIHTSDFGLYGPYLGLKYIGNA